MLKPDSVSRVSPPNMTIPNTLAAEPSNQYATDFELVSGHDELFDEVDLVFVAMSCANAPSGDVDDDDGGAAIAELWLRENDEGVRWRKAERNGVCRTDV